MQLALIIAQAVAEQPLLYTYGPLGVICGWLMWRDERRSQEFRSHSHRLDGLTRAILVDLTERDTCGPTTKRYAHEEIAKISARMPKE